MLMRLGKSTRKVHITHGKQSHDLLKIIALEL
jgi:hypothetical protein